MSDMILTEARTEQLVDAIEDNYVAMFRQMTDALGGDLTENARGGRHFSFPSNPMFKGVWRTRLSVEDADAEIADAVEWFKRRDAPFFFWWTGAHTMPADLGHRLLAHGFTSWETDGLDPALPSVAQGAPAMAADMRAFDESVLEKAPDGFTIRQVATDDDLLAFKHVFQTTYGLPEWAAQAWVDASRHAGIDRTPWHIYVGWLDGAPVACNILVMGGGIASVWGIATLPEAQRKGIGAAITLGPLLDARAAGYRYAGLFATPKGVPVYARIGFTDTGTRINRYLWRSPG